MRGRITTLIAAVAAAVGTAGAVKWARERKGDEELDLEVSTTPPPRVESASTQTTSRASASAETFDDLTAIKGLGKVKAAKLVAAGVTSYAQIASWTDDDIAEMGLKCNTSPGQIKREDWVGQAKALSQA